MHWIPFLLSIETIKTVHKKGPIAVLIVMITTVLAVSILLKAIFTNGIPISHA